MRSGLCGLTLIAALPAAAPLRAQPPPAASGGAVLKPTSHPRLPSDLSQLWLAPTTASHPPALDAFAAGGELQGRADFAPGPPIFPPPPPPPGPPGPHAQDYPGPPPPPPR